MDENQTNLDQGLENDELFEHYRIEADPNQTVIRLDKYLMDKISNITRSKLQAAIKDGFVKVNGEEVKSNYKVRPNDEIVIEFPEPSHKEEVVPEDIPLNIIYEDEELLVVYKPAGMVVHPAHNNWSGTLVNGLSFYLNNLPTSRNGDIRPGLVHRIDKDTSGLLVVAKTEESMTHLAKQFFDHTVERTYYAIVWGTPDDRGTVNAHVGRSLKDRRVMTVFPEGEFGKHAVTHYKLLKSLDYVSLIQCNLETGRTHQIRAHMKHIGYPLFNDATYGGDKVLKGDTFTKYKQFVKNTFDVIPRQALHAKTLGFIHPKTGEKMQFDTDIPDDMKAALARWESYIDHR